MKKGIACVLLSAMVAFGSFAAGCGGNSQEAGKKTFTIAYAPNESTTDSTDARSTLAKDLGKVINMEVKEIQASDYTAIIEALRTGKADMAYMGALAVAMGAERAGVTPIVMPLTAIKRRLFTIPYLLPKRITAKSTALKILRAKPLPLLTRIPLPAIWCRPPKL